MCIQCVNCCRLPTLHSAGHRTQLGTALSWAPHSCSPDTLLIMKPSMVSLIIETQEGLYIVNN